MLTLVLAVTTATRYIDEAKTAASGYPKWILEDDNGVSVEYRNPADHSNLSIFAYKAAPGDLDQRWARHTTKAVAYKGPPVPYSGMPLGTHVEAFETDARLKIYVRNGDTFATVQLGRIGRRGRDEVTWLAADKPGDRLDVEGVARKLIALIEGRWSTSAGTVRVGASDIARRRCRDGASLVPLDQWCLARNVAPTFNHRLGTASFTRSGRAVVLPLGARSIKIGPSWIPFDGTVSLVGDDWFAPLELLERS